MDYRFEAETQFDTVRKLKGAAISILNILMIVKRMGMGPCSNEFLELRTGYSDKTLANGLALLDFYHQVNHGQYGWTLAGGAVQLPLMADLLESGITDNNQHPSNSLDRSPMRPVADGAVSRRISESENFRSSSSGLTNLDSRFIEPLPDSRAGESENFRVAVLAEIDRHGIRDPARSRLAELGHITINLVRFHCETSNSLGQAIFRIEHNWKIRSGWAPADESPVIQDEQEGEPESEDDPEEPKNEIWESVLSCLQPELAKTLFETWVLPLRPGGLDQGNNFTVRAMNEYGREIIESRMARTIERILSGLIGRNVRLVVTVG